METENNEEKQETGPLSAPPCSALRVETWKCSACGQHVPCVVSLTYELTGYPIDDGDHYRRQSCLAREPKLTDWKRMPND